MIAARREFPDLFAEVDKVTDQFGFRSVFDALAYIEDHLEMYQHTVKVEYGILMNHLEEYL